MTYLCIVKNIHEHQTHLQNGLRSAEEKNQLFIRHKKCEFAVKQIEYLGHVVSQDGVVVDQQKIEAMLQWPRPGNVKALRGFLGLTCYYRRFVRGYGEISKPLTQFLKKGGFQWSDSAEIAFQQLKNAMSTTPVLRMPDLSKNSSLRQMRATRELVPSLCKQDNPSPFLARLLHLNTWGLSTYEKELLAILMAVENGGLMYSVRNLLLRRITRH